MRPLLCGLWTQRLCGPAELRDEPVVEGAQEPRFGRGELGRDRERGHVVECAAQSLDLGFALRDPR
jgi:hypothetical protein